MQISFSKYLVAALSLPSITISQSFTISAAFLLFSLVSYVSTFICLLKLWILSLALSVLNTPMFFSVCITYLWRLDSSTISPSTIPRVPTPAPERYKPAGDPRPPAPTINTLDPLSFYYPSNPISFIISYLEYLMYSSFVSSCLLISIYFIIFNITFRIKNSIKRGFGVLGFWG